MQSMKSSMSLWEFHQKIIEELIDFTIDVSLDFAIRTTKAVIA
jgi:hypothetical protein